MSKNIVDLLKSELSNKDNSLLTPLSEVKISIPEQLEDVDDNLEILKLEIAKDKFSVNLLTKVNGTVSINEEEKIPTFIYSKIAIIKGGELVRDDLTINNKKINFKNLDLIDIENSMPATKNKIVLKDSLLSAKLNIIDLEASYKVTKYFLDRDRVKEESLYPDIINSDGSLHIDTHYKPPAKIVEKLPLFDIKIKGLSSLPSVNAVMKRLGEGKSLLLGQQIIYDKYVDIESNLSSISKDYLKAIKTDLESEREKYTLFRTALELEGIKIIEGDIETINRELSFSGEDSSKYSFDISFFNPNSTLEVKENDIDIVM
jgi:hypothetical protein